MFFRDCTVLRNRPLSLLNGWSLLRLIRVIVVYRLPYSHIHPVTKSTFTTEFSNFLESVVLFNEQLHICGDLKVHVNVA